MSNTFLFIALPAIFSFSCLGATAQMLIIHVPDSAPTQVLSRSLYSSYEDVDTPWLALLVVLHLQYPLTTQQLDVTLFQPCEDEKRVRIMSR